MAAFVAWMLSACGGSPVDQAALQRQLMETDRAFAQATADRGAVGWASYFAAEGTMIAGSRSWTGPEQIKEVMAPFFSAPGNLLEWEPTKADVAADGGMGYTVGTYRRTTAGPQGPAVGTGSYLTVWKLQSDGSWKVAADLGSPDPEPK